METIDIFIRMVLAIIIGGFIGYEREMRNRPAGFITHTLVCVGATIIALIQENMVYEVTVLINENPNYANALKADLGRIVSQVVTGVGFLGAGTIIFDKGSVKGLTTATTLWVSASLGIAIGLGYYRIAIISALMTIFIMIFLKKFEIKARNYKYMSDYIIRYNIGDGNFISKSTEIFNENKVEVRNIKKLKTKEKNIKSCEFRIYTGFLKNERKVIDKLIAKDQVISITKK